MKKVFVGIILAASAIGIGWLFWAQELKYTLPTPVPANFVSVHTEEAIDLHTLPSYNIEKASYLHFFNPDCPCSRFNLQHFAKLVKDFGDRVQVYAVIPAYADLDQARSMIDNEKVIVLQDSDDSIARACGVYSTPQAVVITNNQKLFYRGNYNKSRYCTTKETNYAEIALTALVSGEPSPHFNSLATQSYGCELPNQNNTSILQQLFK